MKYGKIPYVNKPVSRIFCGTGGFPYSTGNDEESAALLSAMLEMGITAFDTARVYGDSEETVGKWLKEGNLYDKVVILSKGCHFDVETGKKRVGEKEMREDLETSLRKLGTDHIDIYLLHRDDPAVPVAEIVETFNEMHRDGLIGAFGGSNWTEERLREANAYAEAHGLIPFSVSSPNFSLARQVRDPYGGGCISLSGSEEDLAWYRDTQMAVISYSSLAHGFLSGQVSGADETRGARVLDPFGLKGFDVPENYERLRRCEKMASEKGVTVPQLALAWLYHQGVNEFAVIKSVSAERMKSNCEALDISITEEEAAWLYARRA